MLPLTKRQREILDYLNDFIQQHGYAPSLEEIGRRFGLSSLATVHKHLTNLQEKGFIKRSWNRSRSVELIPARMGTRSVEVPLLGRALAVATALAFAIALGEFGATVLLARAERPTVPVAIFRFLGRPGADNVGTAMALCVVLMALVAACGLVGERGLARRDRP